jgi:O-antigen ligase
LFTTPLLAALVAVSGFALSLEIFLGGPLLHLLRGAHPLTWYNRGISYVAVLVFPIMAGLWVSNKRSAVLLFALAFLVPMAMTESRAAKMAYALGLLVVLLASFMPLLTRRALTFFIFLCPLWPFAVQKFFLARHDLVMRLPASWHDRVDIWDNMSYRILEHPWLGWGLTTSHFLPCSEPHGALYLYPMQCPGHPHNAIIQLWVDLGIPGLLFGLIFAFLVLFWIGKLDRRIMPFALGAFAAALSLSFVAYDFWTDSLFSMFAMAIFAFALLETKIANDFKTKPVFPVLQA